jgi:hypothetical protein
MVLVLIGLLLLAGIRSASNAFSASSRALLLHSSSAPDATCTHTCTNAANQLYAVATAAFYTPQVTLQKKISRISRDFN